MAKRDMSKTYQPTQADKLPGKACQFALMTVSMTVLSESPSIISLLFQLVIALLSLYVCYEDSGIH